MRLFCLFASALLASAGAQAQLLDFTAPEMRAIQRHGPWPAPWSADPSNRVSARPAAIEFGERLFFEPRLSPSGKVLCATCHVPFRAWQDARARAFGLVEVDRNTQSLLNVRYNRWFGWDGAGDSLWAQSIRPILDAREMGGSQAQAAALVRGDAELSCSYGKTFGAPPPADDALVLADIGKALAAFQETLVSGRTPFDRFRDAVAKGEPPSSWNFSEPALRGLKIFVGKGECTTCHSGPNFTGGEFFNTGLSRFEPRGRPDAGRESGIKQVMASRFNLLGPHNDDKTGASAEHLRKVTQEKTSPGEFKVPSLRNLLLTAPYGRDGRVETVPRSSGTTPNSTPAACVKKARRTRRPPSR